MKKSFMTRILATGLSFAMAFSMAAATNVTPASAASKPVLVDYVTGGSGKAVTVNVGEVAKLKVNAATKKTYAVSSVKKSSKKIKTAVSKTGTVVYVRGVAETGEKDSAIRVSFKVKKTGKTSKFTFASKVKVVAKKVAEETLALSEVKQTASNAIVLSFNKDASKDVTKENLVIKTADDKATQLNIKSVETVSGTEGKQLKVTIYGSLTNNQKYNITSGETIKGEFTATVGEVASIAIKTTTAEQNTKTKIEYALLDANLIDVTPSINLTTKVYISVDGSYADRDISDASDAYVTMANEGDKVNVKVTYNSGVKDAADVVAEGEIVCVKAAAVEGTGVFSTSKNLNPKSDCAKFYIPSVATTTAKVKVSASSTNIYFYVPDKNGDAVKFDSYEVESGNDNIVSANVGSVTGKYAIISATGNNIGTAALTVKATKNGQDSYFSIPVSTYDPTKAVKMTVEIDKTAMSDSADNDYSNKVTAILYDANGDKVKGNFTAEVKDVDNVSNPIKVDNNLTSNQNDTEKAVFAVTAHNADGRNYSIEVKGSDQNANATDFTRRVSVTVKELPEVLKNISYQLETTKTTLDEAKALERSSTIALAAYCNGLFAGYVRLTDKLNQGGTGNASGYTIGGKAVATGEGIVAVTMSAIYGNKVYGTEDGSGQPAADGKATKVSLVNTGDAITIASSAAIATGTNSKAAITINSVSTAAISNHAVDTHTDVAVLGNYTVRFKLATEDDVKNKKVQTKEVVVKVTNSYPMPKVTVVNTKVKNVSTWQTICNDENLKANVDLNNDTSAYESITGFYNTDYSAASSANGKMVVKYVAVEDTVWDQDTTDVIWTFYVPVNVTFIQK